MENTENKFKHDGLWYIAVEQDGCRNCDFCAINTGCVLDQTFCTVPACNKGDRQDKRNVIFVESDVDNLGDEDGYLKSIAAEYHRRAEEYDRKVCTGQIINGSVMPSSNTELQMINIHANSLLKELKERARIEFGIDGSEVARAIRKYSGVI